MTRQASCRLSSPSSPTPIIRSSRFLESGRCSSATRDPTPLYGNTRASSCASASPVSSPRTPSPPQSRVITHRNPTTGMGPTRQHRPTTAAHRSGADTTLVRDSQWRILGICAKAHLGVSEPDRAVEPAYNARSVTRPSTGSTRPTSKPWCGVTESRDGAGSGQPVGWGSSHPGMMRYRSDTIVSWR